MLFPLLQSRESLQTELEQARQQKAQLQEKSELLTRKPSLFLDPNISCILLYSYGIPPPPPPPVGVCLSRVSSLQSSVEQARQQQQQDSSSQAGTGEQVAEETWRMAM